jgi:hypothetical protein
MLDINEGKKDNDGAGINVSSDRSKDTEWLIINVITTGNNKCEYNNE